MNSFPDKFYLGPWKSDKINKSKMYAGMQLVCYRLELGKTKYFVSIFHNKNTNLYHDNYGCAMAATLKEAMNTVDGWLNELNSIFLTQDQFDKYSLLI